MRLLRRLPTLPAKPHKIVFPLLAETAFAELGGYATATDCDTCETVLRLHLRLIVAHRLASLMFNEVRMMRMNFGKQHIPWVMAAARAALGPVLIAGAACSWNGFALAGMVVGALVSDIYDGVLARRWSCDTAGVRLFDSMADTMFYLCTAFALWMSEPQLWRSYGGLLVVLLVLEAVRFAFDFAKFGRPASYHSYLAKLWGLVMAVAVIGVFALDHSNVLVPAALVLGILCNVEGLAMSAVMPVWRKDVKTLAEAWRIRREVRKAGVVRHEARRWRERRRVIFTGFLVLVLGAVLATPAFAIETGQVAYTGGSLSVAQGTVGSFDLASSTALIFKHAGRVRVRMKLLLSTRTSAATATPVRLRITWACCPRLSSAC